MLAVDPDAVVVNERRAMYIDPEGVRTSVQSIVMAELADIPRVISPFGEDPDPLQGHYLQIQLEAGGREYFPLAKVDEEPRQALGRWIETRVAHRRRNKDKAREQVRASVQSYRIARPSSWWREMEEAQEPQPKKRRQRRR